MKEYRNAAFFLNLLMYYCSVIDVMIDKYLGNRDYIISFE